MVVRSKPENGILSTASIPAAASSVTGFCGTVSTITDTVGSDPADLFGDLHAGDAALQQRVHDDDVRRSSLTADMACSPEVITSSILICDWALQERPHVHRHLRNVLDHQQPDLLANPHLLRRAVAGSYATT